MIQFRRGSSSAWRKNKTPLAEGQPGYDKETHKLKIGDGKSSWDELPDASGLRADEILDSEENAKKKVKAVESIPIVGKLLANLARPVFTYGSAAPDDNTKGQVYLQYYDANPETDYIISYGVSGIWTYQIWNSGIAKCFGTLSLKNISVQNAIEGSAVYCDDKEMTPVSYPFEFISTPCEIASLQSPGGISWLASRGPNSTKKSATYSVVSVDTHAAASYNISLQVCGRLK